MTLNTKGPKVSPMLQLPLPAVTNFSPCNSITIHFRVTGHVETSVPNAPKMTLSTKRSKIPHVHVCNRQRVPNFALRSVATRFQVTGHFETSASNDHKLTLNTKGQRYLIYMLQLPPSPKFHSLLLYR